MFLGCFLGGLQKTVDALYKTSLLGFELGLVDLFIFAICICDLLFTWNRLAVRMKLRNSPITWVDATEDIIEKVDPNNNCRTLMYIRTVGCEMLCALLMFFAICDVLFGFVFLPHFQFMAKASSRYVKKQKLKIAIQSSENNERTGRNTRSHGGICDFYHGPQGEGHCIS